MPQYFLYKLSYLNIKSNIIEEGIDYFVHKKKKDLFSFYH